MLKNANVVVLMQAENHRNKKMRTHENNMRYQNKILRTKSTPCVHTESTSSVLCTRRGITNWCSGNGGTGHAGSILWRFKVDVEIVVRGVKDIHGRVAARVPINGDMIDARDFFDVIGDGLVGPAECKVGKAIGSNGRWHDRRIALCHRVRRDGIGFVVFEGDFQRKLAVVIDVLCVKQSNKCKG